MTGQRHEQGGGVQGHGETSVEEQIISEQVRKRENAMPQEEDFNQRLGVSIDFRHCRIA